LESFAEYRRHPGLDPHDDSPWTYSPNFSSSEGVPGIHVIHGVKAYYATSSTFLGTLDVRFPKIMGYRNLDQLTRASSQSPHDLKSECLHPP